LIRSLIFHLTLCFIHHEYKAGAILSYYKNDPSFHPNPEADDLKFNSMVARQQNSLCAGTVFARLCKFLPSTKVLGCFEPEKVSRRMGVGARRDPEKVKKLTSLWWFRGLRESRDCELKRAEPEASQQKLAGSAVGI
jgi:hypothetical protein